jgi:hypothetical protein
MAAAAATNWFAGDLNAVYSVLGLRSPLPPTTYERCIPEDPSAFTKRLRQVLGGAASRGASTKDTVRFTNSIQSLAQHGLAWLNLMEVLGKPPEFAQFSKRDYFKQVFDVLALDLDDAWRIYCNAIQQALEETRRGQAPVAPLRGSQRQQESQREPPGILTVQASGNTVSAPAEARPSTKVENTQPRRGLLKRLLGHR